MMLIDDSDIHLVLISGQSGSGKSTALRSLEDLGWLCIDNMPIALISNWWQKSSPQSGSDFRSSNVAMTVDARQDQSLSALPAQIDALLKKHRAALVFLESETDVLLTRFSETRRRHPVHSERPLSLRQMIDAERALLRPIRDMASLVIDSSTLSTKDLRRRMQRHFESGHAHGIQVIVQSFGFKHGVPAEADLVFDARLIKNPFYDPELKLLRGTHSKVADFVLEQPSARRFLTATLSYIETLLADYQADGRQYLTIAIGCTGGHHRSVATSLAVAESLREKGINLLIEHRDIDK